MPYTHTRFKLTRCCRSSLSFIHGGASLFAHHLMKYEGQKAVNSYIRLPDTHRGVKKKKEGTVTTVAIINDTFQ